MRCASIRAVTEALARLICRDDTWQMDRTALSSGRPADCSRFRRRREVRLDQDNLAGGQIVKRTDDAHFARGNHFAQDWLLGL
jgi:hypothetical protein